MLKKFLGKIKFYFPAKEISDDIHKKNRESVIRIFIFSFVFGTLCLLLKFLGMPVLTLNYFYYGSYAFFGITGIILCKTKSGKYTPTVFCLLCFFFIFLYYSTLVPFTKALVYFIGFIVAIEILTNLNPVIFTICVLFFEIIVLIFLLYSKLPGKEQFEINSVTNIILLSVIVIYISFWKRRIVINKYVIEKKIDEEKKKSEELLLNVLPRDIMEQLRSKGSVEPEAYENTSVLFCQIVNYAELSAQIGPEKLVNELNDVFGVFDDIVEKNSCMRIKTMGRDLYGCMWITGGKSSSCRTLCRLCKRICRVYTEA